MKNLKKFEEHTTVKLSDLIDSGNYSADYHVNKTKGKNPYVKKEEMMVKIGKKVTIPKDAIYLTSEQYNKLAKELIRIKKEQEDIMKDLKNIIK